MGAPPSWRVLVVPLRRSFSHWLPSSWEVRSFAKRWDFAVKIFTQICCVKLRVLIAAEQMEDDVIPTMTVKNELFKEKQSTKKKEKSLQSFTHRVSGLFVLHTLVWRLVVYWTVPVLHSELLKMFWKNTQSRDSFSHFHVNSKAERENGENGTISCKCLVSPRLRDWRSWRTIGGKNTWGVLTERRIKKTEVESLYSKKEQRTRRVEIYRTEWRKKKKNTI